MDSPQARPSVLLVDDDEEIVEAVGRLLRARGHAVHTALGCREALKVALRHGCDVLVSDLVLPDGDGSALLRALRAHRPVPAVAITGTAAEATRSRAERAGFGRVLGKPFLIETLAEAIGRARVHPPRRRERHEDRHEGGGKETAHE